MTATTSPAPIPDTLPLFNDHDWSLGVVSGSASWAWCTKISFSNIGRHARKEKPICENHGCGQVADYIVEDEKSYSWACANCAPLIPKGAIVWPNAAVRDAGESSHTQRGDFPRSL